MAGLPGYVEPTYPRGEFTAGAEATLALMAEGVEGVAQGVLYREQRLGIPDLLRRVSGESDLGEHHFEVLDIKSSRRSRSDQLLQVAFYSRLLGEVQGRAPEYGYLILKDGREERFRLAAFAPALAEVEEDVQRLREDPDSARPFLGPACSRCRWWELCGAQLEEVEDLSLLQGMTRGLRTMLERNGSGTCSSLAALRVDATARRTHIPVAQLRRLKRAAESRKTGRPLLEKRSEMVPGALLHFLTDPFEDRVLFMGLLHAGQPAGGLSSAIPKSREQEWSAFEGLLKTLPADVTLLHYGHTVPDWYEDRVRGRAGVLRGRFMDLARLLRGAAVFPGPVFDLADHVRMGLGVDPHRQGHAAAAALWAATPEGQSWLEHKGCSDLEDLVRLQTELLGGSSDNGS